MPIVVECLLVSYLPFFFLDTLGEFRFKELLACKEECPGSTTYELMSRCAGLLFMPFEGLFLWSRSQTKGLFRLF